MSEKVGYLLLKYPQYLWKHAIEKKKSSKIIQNLFCAVEYDDFWNKYSIIQVSQNCSIFVLYYAQYCAIMTLVHSG